MRSWLRYLEAKKQSPLPARFFLYERAVKCLPECYKVWRQYLDLRKAEIHRVKGAIYDRKLVSSLNELYERALCTLHKVNETNPPDAFDMGRVFGFLKGAKEPYEGTEGV
jgi:pre-mRNA-splicing factor SYF1